MSKKKSENQLSEEEVSKAVDRGRAGIAAVNDLRTLVSTFKLASGEQDVLRAQLNPFLAQLEAEINKVAAVFEQ
jgi:hypothetical protein